MPTNKRDEKTIVRDMEFDGGDAGTKPMPTPKRSQMGPIESLVDYFKSGEELPTPPKKGERDQRLENEPHLIYSIKRGYTGR